jgi:hypothetical protein
MAGFEVTTEEAVIDHGCHNSDFETGREMYWLQAFTHQAASSGLDPQLTLQLRMQGMTKVIRQAPELIA